MGKTICKHCDQSMGTGNGCTRTTYNDFPDGIERNRIPYMLEEPAHPGLRWSDVCHDCGVTEGQLHHPGCDVERCPRCGYQAIGCGCTNKEEEDDE